MPYVAEFGLSDEGRGFARPLAILLVRRSQLAAAAELVIAAARLQPEGKRAYSTWRWWETVFGKFENFQELDTAFSLALLDRFALSDAADRRVLAELFGRPDMTTTDVAAMKKAVLEGK